MFEDENLSNIDFVIPRDEREMCSLFEDLLFMKTEKFIKQPRDQSPIAISARGKTLLGQLGITGRIFRRWYQTTWGSAGNSRYFSGETPRQELSVRYPDLADGHAYMNVELVMAREPEIVPHFFTKDEIGKYGGAFSMGRSVFADYSKKRQKLNRLTAPHFDPEFRHFLSDLEIAEKEILDANIMQLPKDTEIRFWKIFWQDAIISFALNLELELPRNDIIKIGAFFHSLLDYAMANQGNGPDDFIDFDNVFRACWDILSRFDKRLLPADKIAHSKGRDSGIDALMNTKDGPYSLAVWYNLSNLFDELILFPADRYFGAVECVWTDKENFLGDLLITYELLNNNLEIKYDKKFTKEQKTFLATGIEEKAVNIYRLWFAPPTAFRFLPRALKYF